MIVQSNVDTTKPVILALVTAMKTENAKLLEAGCTATVALTSMEGQSLMVAMTEGELERLVTQCKHLQKALKK